MNLVIARRPALLPSRSFDLAVYKHLYPASSIALRGAYKNTPAPRDRPGVRPTRSTL